MSDTVPTTCMRCAVGCGHVQRAVSRGYGIDVVRGDGTHPVNKGLACSRGVSETADPDGEWLSRPHVRRNGELLPTTWETALDRAAEGLSAAAGLDAGDVAGDSDGGVAVLGSGQQTNEAAYALGKFARGGLGTELYDANTTLCMASAVTAYYDAFGSDAPPPTYDDVPAADRHVVWGANPAVAHPVMFRWIADAADDLVVVDPVATMTAGEATTHVAVDPGADFELARAVLAQLVATDRVDEAFVAAATEGFDVLREALPEPAAAAADAGVALADVEALADAMSDRALLYWGMGVNQSVRGTATARSLVDLCLATGNLRPGSGPFSLTGQANSMGTRVCSSKGTWPGQRDFQDPAERRTVADAWDVPVDRLPDAPGPGPVGILEAEPDAVYAVATNPAVGFPNAETARATLEDTFLVVQDAFRSETVAYADVVLPAATWGETEGTTMNMERRLSRVRAATETPTGVRGDLELVVALADRLAPGLFAATGDDPEAVYDEFRHLTAGTAADCSGVSYDRLDAAKAVRWPAPDADSEGGYRYHDAETDSWSFPTPSGRAAFYTGDAVDLPDPVDDDYPLTLTTGREPDGYNSGVRSGEDPERPTARINPETLAESCGGELADGDDDGDGVSGLAGSNDGDGVRGLVDGAVLSSRRGAIEVDVDPDPAVPAGLVWLPIHHRATNILTTPARDAASKEPNFKQCAVRLAPATTEPSRPVGAPVGGDD